MAHNISLDRLRANLLTASLGFLEMWPEAELHVRCPSCRTWTVGSIRGLQQYVGRGAVLRTAVDRLRCTTPGCGRRPGEVVAHIGDRRVTLLRQSLFM